MVNASFQQTSFLGGEWSPNAQGRMDSDHYKTALNVCSNYCPVESGALTRRQGTRFLGTTKGGAAGRVMGFDFSVVAPYQVELTDGFLRVWHEAGIIDDGTSITISALSSASPAEITATGSLPGGWATGNTVIFQFTGNGYATKASRLRNWQFVITKTASNKFTIVDAVSGLPIDGSTIVGAAGGVVRKVWETTTPWTSSAWKKLRKVQDEKTVLFLHPTIKPQVLTVGSPFALNPAVFTDGPYLDIPTSNGSDLGGSVTTLTPSGTTGTITITASGTTDINNGSGFVSTDVGRMIRVYSEPPQFSDLNTYEIGDTVTFEGVYYSAVRHVRSAVPAVTPAVNVSSWSPVTDVAFWSWGVITVVTDTTHITVQLKGHDIVNTLPVAVWRLGLFGDTLGYPTCGAFHEGRLWLSGVIANRVDGSFVGQHYNFAPTSNDGTVSDANGCADVFDGLEANAVFWLITRDDGMWAGTQAGEWRVRASNLDDPITPTSVQVRQMTKFGCANIEPVNTPRAALFVQRMTRKVIEFLSAPDNGCYGVNISVAVDHLMGPGIAELAWQHEPTNTMWARMNDGTLLQCVYLRAPREFFWTYVISQERYYVAWCPVVLGCDRITESISVGPADDGKSDKLFLVTNDPVSNVRHVVVATDQFRPDDPDWSAEFADDIVQPSGASVLAIANGDAIDGIRFYGLWPQVGMTVSIVLGGLDLGDFQVTTDTLDIPFSGDFTLAFIVSLSGTADFGNLSTTVVQS